MAKIELDDDTTVAQARTTAASVRHVGKKVRLALIIADLLELPDDIPLVPAVEVAAKIPTELTDPASVKRTRDAVLARFAN
jgi:hypothetical protein